MKNYEKPTVETVKINNDVITTSIGTVNGFELLENDNGKSDISWTD